MFVFSCSGGGVGRAAPKSNLIVTGFLLLWRKYNICYSYNCFAKVTNLLFYTEKTTTMWVYICNEDTFARICCMYIYVRIEIPENVSVFTLTHPS